MVGTKEHVIIRSSRKSLLKLLFLVQPQQQSKGFHNFMLQWTDLINMSYISIIKTGLSHINEVAV